jgi:anti-sigma factor RsiW
MAECRDIELLFAPYVDGEATTADCASIEAHIRACPSCQAKITCERSVREALVMRRASLRPTASDTLRRRCEACQPAAPPLSPRSTTRRTWVPLSMVATLVLALSGVFFYGLRGGSQALAAQLAVDHVKCFEFAPDPSVIPNAEALSREWTAMRGWTLHVPASAPREELQLLGVRRCISTEGQTAHLMYKWRGQPLSVYVLNSAHPRIGAMPQIVERLGQEAIMWSKGGRTYAVVTRGRPSEIEHVADYVRTVAE